MWGFGQGCLWMTFWAGAGSRKITSGAIYKFTIRITSKIAVLISDYIITRPPHELDVEPQ